METLLFSGNCKGFYSILGLSMEEVTKAITWSSRPENPPHGSSPLPKGTLPAALKGVCTSRHLKRLSSRGYLIRAEHETSPSYREQRSLIHTFTASSHIFLSVCCVYLSLQMLMLPRWMGPWGQSKYPVMEIIKRSRKKRGRRRREISLFPFYGGQNSGRGR